MASVSRWGGGALVELRPPSCCAHRATWGGAVCGLLLMTGGCVLPRYESSREVDCALDPALPHCSASIGAAGAGAAAMTGAPVVQTLELVDDLEDGDTRIHETGGRRGNWFTTNDSTGNQTLTLVAGGMNGSGYCIGTAGAGFTGWGPQFGFVLNWDGTSNHSWDGSAYDGIVFWARINAGSITRFNLAVNTADTTEGYGVCTECYDAYLVEFDATNSWKEYVFRFSDLAQEGWGAPLVAELDSSVLTVIDWRAGTNVTFDLQIDDVAFFTE